MRVAIIIERYDTSLGGAERSVHELAGALQRAGVETDILAATGRSQTRNVHILCGNCQRRVGLEEFSAAVREHLRSGGYDLVHSTLPMSVADVYQPRGGTCAETIIRNAASYENALIEWFKNGTSWLNLRRGQLLKAEELLCRQKDGPVVAALSKYVAEQFKVHYAMPPEKIEVIPNGIKIENVTDAETVDKMRGQIFVKLGVQEAANPAIFLFIAHNFRLKGLGPLLRALAIASKLKNDRPPVVVVAGGGSTTLFKLIAMRLGIRNRLLFLGATKNVPAAIAASDAVVLPTFYDPCSRAILEGLAAGKPVITTSYNGAAEFFENGRHGMVVEQPEDDAELARAINYYCNEENAAKASDAIKKDRLADFISVDRHAAQLVKLYERILEKRGRR
ncbi:MAG TPA: glycosyltransferase family 4 protein [Sedimentisphaerales bacterium]|nr:glycosyltransferase family 4 protein [Sedimentisphaerales bacterium]